MAEPGCCADKRYGGKGCTEESCMTLPAGSVCGGCVFVEHCVRMYGVTKDRTMCDFFPRRFKAAAPVEVPDG
jgi:hypothetical protein